MTGYRDNFAWRSDRLYLRIQAHTHHAALLRAVGKQPVCHSTSPYKKTLARHCEDPHIWATTDILCEEIRATEDETQGGEYDVDYDWANSSEAE